MTTRNTIIPTGNASRNDNINGNALTRRARRDIDPLDSLYISKEEKARRTTGRNPKLIREIEYNRDIAKGLDTYDMLDSLGY